MGTPLHCDATYGSKFLVAPCGVVRSPHAVGTWGFRCDSVVFTLKELHLGQVWDTILIMLMVHLRLRARKRKTSWGAEPSRDMTNMATLYYSPQVLQTECIFQSLTKTCLSNISYLLRSEYFLSASHKSGQNTNVPEYFVHLFTKTIYCPVFLRKIYLMERRLRFNIIKPKLSK